VLAKDAGSEGSSEAKVSRKDARRAAAEAREQSQGLRKAAKAAEAELARLTEQRSVIDRAMFDPSSAAPDLAELTMTALMKHRAEVEAKIEAAEAAWLEASEKLEQVAA
jgi:ATP-binding cassette subfamily F protein 3